MYVNIDVFQLTNDRVERFLGNCLQSKFTLEMLRIVNWLFAQGRFSWTHHPQGSLSPYTESVGLVGLCVLWLLPGLQTNVPPSGVCITRSLD